MLIKDKLKDISKFSSSERQIAEFILGHPDEFIDMSIIDVSRHLYVSKSTIIRFSKKLGFTGHKDLCLTLAKEMNTFGGNIERLEETIPFASNDSDKTIADKITMLNFQALTDTYSYVDLEQLRNIADQIREKRKITMYGLVESFLLAADFQYKLMNIGINASLSDVPGLYFRQSSVQEEDSIAFIISYYGRHTELIQTAQLLSLRNIHVILLTGPGNNPIIPYADEIIRVNVNEPHPKIGSISSRTAMSLVLDIIYSYVFSSDYEENLQYVIERSEIRKNIRGES
ncbi:MAG: MurR/RpiR family transcriptional regulator [Solobacterium sp.]|nr:MurR/RpiR family transcriptional regulator [Solobacterium sp.]